MSNPVMKGLGLDDWVHVQDVVLEALYVGPNFLL